MAGNQSFTLQPTEGLAYSLAADIKFCAQRLLRRKLVANLEIPINSPEKDLADLQIFWKRIEKPMGH